MEKTFEQFLKDAFESIVGEKNKIKIWTCLKVHRLLDIDQLSTRQVRNLFIKVEKLEKQQIKLVINLRAVRPGVHYFSVNISLSTYDFRYMKFLED